MPKSQVSHRSQTRQSQKAVDVEMKNEEEEVGIVRRGRRVVKEDDEHEDEV